MVCGMLTFLYTFQSSDDKQRVDALVHRFKKIDQEPRTAEAWLRFDRRLQDGQPKQALAALEEFRKELGINV